MKQNMFHSNRQTGNLVHNDFAIRNMFPDNCEAGNLLQNKCETKSVSKNYQTGNLFQGTKRYHSEKKKGLWK